MRVQRGYVVPRRLAWWIAENSQICAAQWLGKFGIVGVLDFLQGKFGIVGVLDFSARVSWISLLDFSGFLVSWILSWIS